METIQCIDPNMDYFMGRIMVYKRCASKHGEHPITHPHHRFWAYDPGNGYPPPPPGAIAGGPNSNPTEPDALNAGLLDKAPFKRYIDVIGPYSTDEITIQWNAPPACITTFPDERSHET